MVHLRRTASAATAQGVPCHIISAREAGERYPIMRTDDLQGALWLPSDGKANPADVTQALAKGARMAGARIFEKTRVTAVQTRNGAVTGVSTPRGDIACEIVVNCAGQWAKQVGRLCGVTVPLHAAEHMYIVTGRIEGVHPDLPVLRDPDGYVYFKEEVGGLLMGGFEPVAKPWGMDGIPDDFEFGILPDDWDQFQILMENALMRVPALETRRGQDFHEWSRELHARQQFHPRRGAGAQEFLRRRRLQLDRHRVRGRRRAWRSPNGSSRASLRSTSGRSTSAASPPSTATTLG